jgi:hypothetical protein
VLVGGPQRCGPAPQGGQVHIAAAAAAAAAGAGEGQGARGARQGLDEEDRHGHLRLGGA